MAPAAALFTGALQAYAGKVKLGGAPGATPAAMLAEPDALRAVIELFVAARPGAPWQPACSMWSQWYFGTLMAPAVVLTLAAEPPPSWALRDVHVSFCPVQAVPLAFHATAPAGARRAGPSLAPLLHDHVEPVIEALRTLGGLSANLLWENLSWPLAWTLRELATAHPDLRPAMAAMLDADGFSAKPRRVLATARAMALDGGPFHRRLCCLRDKMPGVVNCGVDFCPRQG